jgi:hypothetical protein
MYCMFTTQYRIKANNTGMKEQVIFRKNAGFPHRSKNLI